MAIVFAFDRDWTVDVNSHPRPTAAPLEWVRHLAQETDHAVYAIGNQTIGEWATLLPHSEFLHPVRGKYWQ